MPLFSGELPIPDDGAEALTVISLQKQCEFAKKAYGHLDGQYDRHLFVAPGFGFDEALQNSAHEIDLTIAQLVDGVFRRFRAKISRDECCRDLEKFDRMFSAYAIDDITAVLLEACAHFVHESLAELVSAPLSSTQRVA